MKQALILIQIAISLNAFCQISIVNTNKYYDEEYFEDSGHCYTYIVNDKFIKNNDYDIADGYLKLSVLRTARNMIEISLDDNGLYVPYDRHSNNNWYWPEQRKDLSDEELKEYSIESFASEVENIDTIIVIRNNLELNRSWMEIIHTDGKLIHCLTETPYEVIRFVVFNNSTRNSLEYKNRTVEVDIEFTDKDVITTNHEIRILCPEEINIKLIKKINRSLIDFKYLSEGNRHKFSPEIKGALRKFQKDYFLLEGFIDQQTLNTLGISH